MKFSIYSFWSFFIGIIVLTLTSCSTYATYFHPNFEDERTVTPEIGKIATASLGDPIITTGTGHYTKVLRVTKDCSKPDFQGGKMNITKGLYQMIHKTNYNEYYLPINPKQTYWENIYGEQKSETWNSQIRISNNGEVGIITKNDRLIAEDFKNILDYDVLDSVLIENENSFQQTMLYIGKENNVVRFSYREFSDSYIRDSFTTEVSYDLTESRIIGFKKFKAKIIEATNTQLEYIITSGF